MVIRFVLIHDDYSRKRSYESALKVEIIISANVFLDGPVGVNQYTFIFHSVFNVSLTLKGPQLFR